jgi:hypothetical protein
MGSTTWHKLVQRYALCARELSDAEAELGKQVRLGPELSSQLLEDIKKKHEAWNAAAEEIDRYVKQKADAAKCG